MILRNINNWSFKLRNAKVDRIVLYTVNKNEYQNLTVKTHQVTPPDYYRTEDFGISTDNFNNIEIGEIEKSFDNYDEEKLQAKKINFLLKYNGNSTLFLYIDGQNIKREFIGRVAESGIWLEKYKVTVFGHEYEYFDRDCQTRFYFQEEMTAKAIAERLSIINQSLNYKYYLCGSDTEEVIRALLEEYDITPKWVSQQKTAKKNHLAWS